jgi:hypothetical protein
MKTIRFGSALVTVYDGRYSVGFVLSRGKAGFEAFDRDEQSRGLFASQKLAANEQNCAAETPPPTAPCRDFDQAEGQAP